MDNKSYKDSGILELYVAGSLSEKENGEVYALMQQYPEVTKEVMAIEASIIKLIASAAPKDIKNVIYEAIQDKLDSFNDDEQSIIPINKLKILSSPLK